MTSRPTSLMPSIKTGQDTGLLATAVPSAGAGKPAVEATASLEIDADPSRPAAYVTTRHREAGPGDGQDGQQVWDAA